MYKASSLRMCKCHLKLYYDSRNKFRLVFGKCIYHMTRAVGQSVDKLVGLFVCHNFLKGWEDTLPCSYRSTFFTFVLFQYGDTPLHTSARYGHAGVIRILVSAKCNASEQNKVCFFVIYHICTCLVWFTCQVNNYMKVRCF